MDLKIAKKTIKKIVMRFTYQALKHSVNKRQGKVVFPGFLIYPFVVDANSPTVLHSGWNQLLFFILDYSEACLFRNNMDRADPLTI